MNMHISPSTELARNDADHGIDLNVAAPARWGLWLVLAGFGGFCCGRGWRHWTPA